MAEQSNSGHSSMMEGVANPEPDKRDRQGRKRRQEGLRIGENRGDQILYLRTHVYSVVLASILIYRLACYKRFVQYVNFPQLPSSLLLGHLKVYNDITQRRSLDRDHGKYNEPLYEYNMFLIHDILGRPTLVLMDFRPICRPVVFIACHEVAEQISRPTSLFRTSVPKVDLGYLKPVIGPTSILSAEGDKWKALRRTFNHGFSLQHLLTLLPTILNKTMIFVKHLDRLSESGAEKSLVSLTVNLTYDIIGAVILDIDMDAQHTDPCQRGELVRAFTDLLDAYWDDKIHLPWWFNPFGELRRRRLGKRVDTILKSIVRRKHEEQQQAHRTGQKTQSLPSSIISLSLQDTPVLSQEVLDRTCDQLRTFLLGGHDTPSATLAWVFYELSRTPRSQSAVRAELDVLFGPGTDADAVRTQLASPAGPELLSRMSYITAVIKETLRLHTPASTARRSPPGTGLVVRTPTGENLNMDDVIIYNCNSIIHRDRVIFGATADNFMPERWLDDSNNKTSIPPTAWRPFERGPRACIGQEFASIEMRIIIAVVARQYEFSKVGLGELALDATSGLPILRHDARPVDGIMMKVKRVKEDDL
ncbi:cytochrome P450 monooxygenase, putative [Talaromyces stipitatus ATCC 10500]|uniref:Cytochrome P450 monooxygenase, putative n=1 Tax=Talaromyces stipitatus (strain ATCC 10500 / CBS 375.48 / QM 6759 / NRRL 1006) TaxID=441959 RepID=B8MVG6_TALSN|nr:cytochrome P450 monooxygenase, putative [Talaromyces stipitatus ATCC 10500]EED11475.1 cytochrome P450 monooxygenase, putative [Talaromyces stipitatus ATCC 10500]